MRCAKYVILFLILLQFPLSPDASRGQEVEFLEEKEAQFILNYIQFVTWPNLVAKKNDPITICLFPSEPVSVYLRKKVGNTQHSIIIKEKAERDSLEDCHILFIGKKYREEMDYYIHITQGKPVLTVSDAPNFCERGGVTGFLIDPDQHKVQLELNIHSLEESGLKISPDLLAIMKVYR